jgi:hypothetical protein
MSKWLFPAPPLAAFADAMQLRSPLYEPPIEAAKGVQSHRESGSDALHSRHVLAAHQQTSVLAVHQLLHFRGCLQEKRIPETFGLENSTLK